MISNVNFSYLPVYLVNSGVFTFQIYGLGYNPKVPNNTVTK